MGSIAQSSRILVTGANGFIGAYCVAELLASGYEVVATVRTAAKAEQVLRQHGNSPALSVKIVPDVTEVAAFDEAIQGCNGVLHLASPFGTTYHNFEKELLIPSINGSKSICLAASGATSVKRVVLTSSFAASFNPFNGPSPGKVYTEDDWSPLTYEDGKKAAATPMAYRASKKLAEEAAWEYVKGEKPSWDLVTLCPAMVFGKLYPGTISSVKELNTSNAIIWSLFDAKEVPESRAPLWSSVTALARAHRQALEMPEAGGERIFVINGDFDNQELADIIHESPALDESVKKRVPKGIPSDRLKGKIYTADSSKAKRLLGIDLKESGENLPETVIGLVQQLLGFEQAKV